MMAQPDQLDCPVLKETETALKSARDLSHSMKRLARLIRNCQNCQKLAQTTAGETDFRSECPVLMEINSQIETAILELNREWVMLP